MSKKVLIIDDEEDIVDLVKNRLESYNFSVVTADNGLEGIAKIDDERPDLVIVDILMPHLNGINFVKIIKQYNEFKSIPVIAFTARTGMQDEFKALGIDQFMLKPFDPTDLINKVEALIMGA